MNHDKFIKTSLEMNIIIVLIFMCSIRFVPILSAEFQPIASVLSISILFLKAIKYKKVNIYVLYLFIFSALLLPHLLIGISRIGLVSIIHYISYLLGPALLVYFIIFKSEFSVRIINVIYQFFICVALIQLLTPNGIAITINPILDLIVSRMQVGTGWGIRGVSLIYSEPAHAAKFIWLLFAFSIYFKEKNLISDKDYNFHLAFLFILIIVTRSASIFFLFALTVLIYYAISFISRENLTKTIKDIITIILLLLMVVQFDLWRFGRLEQLVMSYNELSSIGFELNDIQLFGSIRIISVIGGYASIFIDPNGFGIGNGGYHTIDILKNIGFEISKIGFIQNQMSSDFLKPSSYFSILSIDLGVLGFLISSIFFIWSCTKIDFKNNRVSTAVGLVSIFQLFFMSTASLPVPWVALALSILLARDKQNAN